MFRKLLPADDNLRAGSLGRLFGKTLGDRRLWQLNRHSAAKGIGWGLFWAFIAVPGQTLGAAAGALATRGNLPLAAAFTWVSNPLTFAPCFYAAYRVGLALTGMEPASDPVAHFRHLESLGLLTILREIGTFVRQNVSVLVPLFVGGVALGIVVGGLGYFAVKGVWRYALVRRWNRRGHCLRCRRCQHLVLNSLDHPGERLCPHCGHPIPVYRRIGLGFAAMARKLRERSPGIHPAGTKPS